MIRQHPFDLAGPPAVQAFVDIRATSTDPPNFATFCKLEQVGTILAEFAPASGTESDPRVAEHYLYLLFAMYRFWFADQTTLTVNRGRLQRLLDSVAHGLPVVPKGACYLALPELWFWARINRESPPEPLDGMFVVADGDETWLTVVAVLGVRPERSGFSQIVVGGDEITLAGAANSVRQPVFHPDFEGAEAAGFLSCISEAELLHLARLALCATAE